MHLPVQLFSYINNEVGVYIALCDICVVVSSWLHGPVEIECHSYMQL